MDFGLNEACLPISPQVHVVADYVGFEPTTYPLTAEGSTTELIVHLIVEVPNGFEPLSLGYKARIISHYTKRPICDYSVGIVSPHLREWSGQTHLQHGH